MFVDEAQIWVKAGDGGNGCLSFHREKFIAKGGPDGGDGGKGGDVYFVATQEKDTLLDFAGKHHWKAENGKEGQGSNKTGASGEDLTVKVPVGTMVYDTDIDLMIKDMNEPSKKVLICKGGKGGKGNKAFATSTNQAPRKTTRGKKGEERNLKLILKLIADAGLVGLPNAGKSTLVSRCSAAKPKIAEYPFTTLEPVLGIVDLPDFRRFVIADIPGIIEGAHSGSGLGLEFLRHIERTRILLHVLDVAPADGTDPVKNFHVINNELKEYSDKLSEKTQIVVANKIDLDPEGEKLNDIKSRLDKDIIPVSAVTGKGIEELSELLWKKIQETKATEE